jgi:hypothetical protein
LDVGKGKHGNVRRDGGTMKERPILFSGPMVRAILDGRKTQTRRTIRICDTPITKAQSDDCARQRGIPTNAFNVRRCGNYVKCDAPAGSATVSSRVECPHGWIEDRLWVKETFMPDPYINSVASTIYRATEPDPDRYSGNHWKPSIFMPRIRSRLTLEITSVRVERLQDISRGDAIEEGCPFQNLATGPDPRRWYADLWESINGTGSWAKNPWVWAIGFKRAQ